MMPLILGPKLHDIDKLANIIAILFTNQSDSCLWKLNILFDHDMIQAPVNIL